MGIINVLDFHVANLIAAGEVVDRPASVVKELLENAIDSGADTVTVEIKRGGVSFIRVSDNGCGMAREDVPVALIENVRTQRIYSPKILEFIEYNFAIDGMEWWERTAADRKDAEMFAKEFPNVERNN